MSQPGANRRPLPVLRSLAELADLVRRHDWVAVRYSAGPESDAGRRSRDHESGLELPGLSANPLTPERWWTRPLEEWLARQLCQYDHLAEGGRDRPWVLTGVVAARGPDCEPVLTDVEPLALLDDELVAQAQERYATAFHPGRGGC